MDGHGTKLACGLKVVRFKMVLALRPVIIGSDVGEDSHIMILQRD